MGLFKRDWIGEYGRRHTERVIRILEKICASDIRVKLTDRPDEICRGCRRKKEYCRKFIPHDVSVASDDRATIYNLGFKLRKVYRSRYLLKRIKKNWFNC